MGSVGLTLPWEHRITGAVRTGERRVETSEGRTGTGVVSLERSQDADVAAACLKGDLRGYEELHRWQGRRMKNLARNLLGSQTDAEDAVQETFLKIQRSIASFRGQSSFVTWTFRILVNTCHDLRRARLRRKDQTSEDVASLIPADMPRAAVAHPSLRMALERALAQLTVHQREVFLLYEVQGFRHAEIAGMLEISETASKNTLFQAKKNLRALLEPPRSAGAGGAQ
ncbi:MAG TPA: RNA polymerase sigma factor [Candidatus Eisenbacteria bacterium]|nr:RNA polymerase sigma factor [Candidatus Eisenbacteria bacterium]